MIKFRLTFFVLLFNFLVLATFYGYYRYFYQPYLSSQSSAQESPPALKISSSPRSLKLALLADVHSSWEKLEQAVKEVNQADFNFGVFLGDLTKVGEPKELAEGKTILNRLNPPYYFLPGNHDVWYAKHVGADPNVYWYQLFKAESSPVCLTLNGFNLIFLNNADEKEKLTQEAWEKLINCLKLDQPALLFTHEPLYHPVSERLMGQYDAGVATEAAQLRDWLCQKKVKLVTAGHLHSFSKYYYACPGGYQVPMLVAGALTAERNFQPPRFLELTVFEDGSFEEKEVVLP